MKVLILTCNTGEGHNSSAAAIKEAFQLRDIICDSVDTLGLLSPKVSSFIQHFHINLYRHSPVVFRKSYGFTERHESVFARRSLVYRSLAGGVPKLRDIVLKGEYDTVICVHVFAALMVTELQRRHAMPIHTSLVATDYTCSPSVGSSDVDCYFIPHEDLKEEFILKGIPAQKLVTSGIPIRGAFFEKMEKAQARESLGRGPEQRNVLLMSGSMGCGPVGEMTERLSAQLPADATLTVVCGNNVKLYRELTQETRENVQVLGFTRDLPLLMSAADLFLSKPGGISITEAAAKHLPMLLLDVVGGCETRNIEFFQKQGWAVAGQSAEDMADRTVELLGQPEALAERSALLASVFARQPAEAICDHLMNRA